MTERPEIKPNRMKKWAGNTRRFLLYPPTVFAAGVIAAAGAGLYVQARVSGQEEFVRGTLTDYKPYPGEKVTLSNGIVVETKDDATGTIKICSTQALNNIASKDCHDVTGRIPFNLANDASKMTEIEVEKDFFESEFPLTITRD